MFLITALRRGVRAVGGWQHGRAFAMMKPSMGLIRYWHR